MKIMLNGEAVDVDGPTLAEALAQLGYADLQVATAVNEEFVPKARRPACLLAQGDRVEVVAPRQGG